MKTLEVSRDLRGVARLAMARPDVFNAFDETMVAELDATFASPGSDDDVRVIVVTDEDQAFSAGADLEWMQRASQGAAEVSPNGPAAQQEIKSLFAQIAVGPITGEVGELTIRTIGRARASEEAREGLSTFSEKRAARWTGTAA